jgi:hypothetical protein
MQGSDQTDVTMEAAGQSQGPQELEAPQQPEAAPEERIEISSLSAEQPGEDQAMGAGQVTAGTRNRIDWTAIMIVAIIAAFFAIVSRLNLQPPNSLTPVAVLSATGCGLLVTAMRKLRTPRGPGLLEAAIAGFFLALFPFLAALTAPGILSALSSSVDDLHGFLTTWALILVFSLLFSIIGATLGHLAFAPLRPLPAQAQKDAPVTQAETEEGEDEVAPAEESDEEVAPEATAPAEAPRSLFSYIVAVVLLGLMPTIGGYVFSAAFDFMLKLYNFFPGPYPTLRLLSGLLPWQVPVPLNLSGASPQTIMFLEWQYWRIPIFLGNPTMFDLVALEPYLLNAAALALLLFSVHRFAGRSRDRTDSPAMALPLSLLLQAMLGLVIALPAALWMMRGLEGLLQMPGIVIPIRTLYLLNPLTLTLDLITGPLVCLLIAILLRFFSARKRIA